MVGSDVLRQGIDEKKKGDLETTHEIRMMFSEGTFYTTKIHYIFGHMPEIYSSIISEGRDWVPDCPSTHKLAHLGKTRLYSDIHTVSI